MRSMALPGGLIASCGCAGCNSCASPTVALASGARDVELRVLLAAELLVLAPLAARAKRGVALHQNVPVDALIAAAEA
jgi:hypothetical protein